MSQSEIREQLIRQFDQVLYHCVVTEDHDAMSKYANLVSDTIRQAADSVGVNDTKQLIYEASQISNVSA